MSSDNSKSFKVFQSVSESVFHIRRCHVCGHVSTSLSASIHKCQDCGKHLAPFYYFDESKLEGLSEMGPYLSLWKQAELGEGQFQPIWGLSTYWQDEDEGNTRGYPKS
jgi:hypothetical protein